MVDLAGAEGEISVLLEVLRHGDQVRQPLPEGLAVPVVITPDGVRPPPRHEGAPAGAAQSHLGEGVGEDEAPGGEAVEVGSDHLRGTEVPRVLHDTNVRSEVNKHRHGCHLTTPT